MSPKMSDPQEKNKTDVEYSSQYGSIMTATTNNDNFSKDGNDIKLAQQPPKPAVRQRTVKQQQLKQAGNQEAQVSSSDRLTSPASVNTNSQDTVTTKGQISLPLPEPVTYARRNGNQTTKDIDDTPARPYPKHVFFIVANEFCERFSYYGLRTVLVLYLKSALGFTDSKATISFHLFATLCYLTPILGAIMADSFLGKFRTILYLSVIYLFGELLLVASSIFWDYGSSSSLYTFVGLFLIGLGTGGIKPCVCALGGDQFLTNEEKWRQGFFSMLYAAINFGSLISMFATPMLRSNFRCVEREDCYPYAFGLPCLLMFVAIVVFALAKNQYNLVPLPEKNVIVMFCQCVWLALKRKFSGFKMPEDQLQQIQLNQASDNTSSSNASISSNEDRFSTNADSRTNLQAENQTICGLKTVHSREKSSNGHHWLYLASDQFDFKMIEDFRSIFAILLLAVPLPVYWTLFDQQSSLWTLQASRMDGKIFGSLNFYLQPDQISVANPVLLLTTIPIFEMFIYPTMAKCNLLTSSIQRITVGGFIAALTFVLSALIEFQIQGQMLPVSQVTGGMANLIFVNGLSQCSMIEPMISYVQIPAAAGALVPLGNATISLQANKNLSNVIPIQTPIDPLSSSKSYPVFADSSSAQLRTFSGYQIRLGLSNSNSTGLDQAENGNFSGSIGCPFDPKTVHEFNIKPLENQASKLFYLEQGNGKLTYKMFNESLELPPPGATRVRFIYESFGSSSLAEKRTFYLIRTPANHLAENMTMVDNKLQFKLSSKEGQVYLSDYLDIPVPSHGDSFMLKSSDSNLRIEIGGANSLVHLDQATRNLLVLHQLNSTHVKLNHQVLQDNSYRISMLYQLAPYLLISISEVMFSITGLQFSYSIAPESMKSIVLGIWSITVAFGNILTVAVESLHLFSNVGYDFLFYASIMAVDMVIFALIGHYYKPQSSNESSNKSR